MLLVQKFFSRSEEKVQYIKQLEGLQRKTGICTRCGSGFKKRKVSCCEPVNACDKQSSNDIITISTSTPVKTQARVPLHIDVALSPIKHPYQATIATSPEKVGINKSKEQTKK